MNPNVRKPKKKGKENDAMSKTAKISFCYRSKVTNLESKPEIQEAQVHKVYPLEHNVWVESEHSTG